MDQWIELRRKIRNDEVSLRQLERDTGIHRQTLRKSRELRCMLGRWGSPEEILGPVIFLASKASSYMTGNDVFVDGGFAKPGITEQNHACQTPYRA